MIASFEATKDESLVPEKEQGFRLLQGRSVYTAVFNVFRKLLL